MSRCFKLSFFGLFGCVLSLLLVATNVFADAPVATPARIYFPSIETIVGNPAGKVTIVEFFDYNCEYCHKMPALLSKLMQSNPNIRIVYRDYPVLGQGSQLAAQAAVAAALQGKYVAMHNALFSSRNYDVMQLATSAGLDSKKLQKDITGRAVKKQLQATAKDANELKLSGVPVVVIAATPDKSQKVVKAYVLTAPSFADLQQAVNAVSGSAG